MKTIRKIFYDDILGLVKNFFALVIVVGICFLPALYAWFNIYSNWDPYGNTGALKMAAVSLDEGFTDENGEYHNQGDTVIDNLHENTAVDWQFVDTEEDAIEGVNSGDYYAAVVIDKQFSYNMYNVLTEEVDKPTLHFYENQKKNPVATKISDTVVQTLQNSINVAFTEVVVSQVFSSASNFSDELENQGGIDNALDNLKTLSADLTTYQTLLTDIIANDEALNNALDSAQADLSNMEAQARKSAEAVGDSAKESAKTETTMSGYSADVQNVLDAMGVSLTNIGDTLSSAELSNDVKEQEKLLQQVAIEVNDMTGLLKTIEAGPIENENIKSFLAELESLGEILKDYQPTTIAGDAVAHTEAQINETIQKAKASTLTLTDKYDNKLVPGIKEALTDLTGTLNDSTTLLNSVGDTFGNLLVMFTAIENSVDSANTSLDKTKDAIVYVNGKLIKVINDVEAAGTSEKVEILMGALSGDPEVYGKFFSSPVNVVTEAVYPIKNYGSAVAPFYSTLAFWVGALILTAIIKVHPDKSKYPNASDRQLFFGRYVLYWVLGQIQAVVIVVGDLFLLKIQCIHPWLFMLAASVTATTFTLLIYSLVVTWGDAGKALAVVIVVIQIAGSSGTYPIELLPDFFKKVYIFFPFPYAINAIRECLCGMYKLDYLIYLGSLSLFIIVALVIGLLVRIPFKDINHYMEERMEETEMM
ncbi:MAG: YhgE/Pip domain-containing protein [Pseudobutyrivibrio sp.]|nr:YhgE/Pip domain-containing protein [Pseudobutyrivibrio sp.]